MFKERNIRRKQRLKARPGEGMRAPATVLTMPRISAQKAPAARKYALLKRLDPGGRAGGYALKAVERICAVGENNQRLSRAALSAGRFEYSAGGRRRSHAEGDGAPRPEEVGGSIERNDSSYLTRRDIVSARKRKSSISAN